MNTTGTSILSSKSLATLICPDCWNKENVTSEDYKKCNEATNEENIKDAKKKEKAT